MSGLPSSSEINRLMQLAQGKTPEQLLRSLPPEQAKKIREILNNKSLTEQLLHSPKAQEMLKKMKP